MRSLIMFSWAAANCRVQTDEQSMYGPTRAQSVDFDHQLAALPMPPASVSAGVSAEDCAGLAFAPDETVHAGEVCFVRLPPASHAVHGMGAPAALRKVSSRMAGWMAATAGCRFLPRCWVVLYLPCSAAPWQLQCQTHAMLRTQARGHGRRPCSGRPHADGPGPGCARRPHANRLPRRPGAAAGDQDTFIIYQKIKTSRFGLGSVTDPNQCWRNNKRLAVLCDIQ